MAIVAITSLPDPHIDMVQSHLDEPLIIVDPLKYPNSSLSLCFEKDRLKFYAEGSLKDVKTIWYRKPNYFDSNELPIEIDKNFGPYVHSTYVNFYKLLYGSFLRARWVSNPWLIQKASNKVSQLEIASQLNFNIPKTIFSNEEDVVRRFIKTNGSIVTKSLTTEKVKRATDVYGFFTVEIDNNVDLSGLKISPAIFQEKVSNQFDIRVTVIGKEAYSCKITKHSRFR